MNWDVNNIEDLFKESFQDYRITPEPSVWNKIEKQLAFKQFLQFTPKHFNVYYLSATLGLLGILMLQFVNFENETNYSSLPSQKQTITTIQNETATAESIVATEPIAEKEKSKTISNKKQDKKTLPSFTLLSDPNAVIASLDIPIIPETTSDFSKISTSSSVELALSQNEGCAPLAVQCLIKSKNIKELVVDFGNGVVSQNNTTTLYTKSGIYIITICATDHEGKQKTILDTVTVFETPKPIAIVDADSQCTENCVVYFYNYSNDANKYLWDFGDENFSKLKDPVHIYTQSDRKRIKLTVWSEKMCADSIFIESPFKSVAENFVVFPTAFIPSESGSNNGYYTLSNYSTDIFYPVHKGILDYKLEIYNRNGLMLFQTIDINQGWDGYYKYQLMSQGVYIWKVSGKYQNQESFEMVGDVTLLRK